MINNSSFDYKVGKDGKKMNVADDNNSSSSAPFSLGDTEFPFKGKIYTPGTLEYTHARQKNYAYNSKYGDEMYPAYFVYPENREFESIISAISFGRKTGLHVMGRSGGHQYCGVSSDNGSVIVDMQEWNTIGDVLDSKHNIGSKLASKYPKMVTVGAGVTLGHLARTLADVQCTIPMGECPSVCVGGHMQSGGWGHLARSNGLFCEYVYGFTIVTAEGLKKVSCKSSGRELDLYSAVRGGSPGAFGIVTDATFLLLSDCVFPNSRGYGQLIPIYDENDNEAMAMLLNLYLRIMNDIGDSSKALGVTLNFSHIARAVPPSKITKVFGCLAPKFSKRVEVFIVEATIIDDTDPSSMKVFQDFIDTTEKIKRTTKNCCLDFFLNIAVRYATPKTLKNGRRRMPLSVINESYVREFPIVLKKKAHNPQQRINKHPFQGQALYPKGHVQLPVDEFIHGDENALTKGGKLGLLAIYKSMATLVGHKMPLDEVASQSYLLGTKRVVGPFPCTAQWLSKIRASMGFDQFGTREGLGDPRTWQNIQAFYDLEREYMAKTEEEIPLCPAGFSSDAGGDTSQGGCVKSLDSLDLTNERVQKRYFDPESKYGFKWVADVKHQWDSADIFHSRFTIPPLKSQSVIASSSLLYDNEMKSEWPLGLPKDSKEDDAFEDNP